LAIVASWPVLAYARDHPRDRGFRALEELDGTRGGQEVIAKEANKRHRVHVPASPLES
jgi:hypothetical protein